jgi:hypothetical protein
MCPDVIIVLGEDISRFRDASKTLYQFLRSFSWNDKAERLGFDEVNGLSVPYEFLLMSSISNRCGLMSLI